MKSEIRGWWQKMTTTAEKVDAAEGAAARVPANNSASAGEDAAAKIAVIQGVTDKLAASASPGVTAKADKPAGAEKPAPRKALGRGLESLLPGGPRAAPGVAASTPRAVPGSMVSQIPGSGSGNVISAINHTGILSELHAEALRRTDGHAVLDLAIDQIDSNPYQTRSKMSKAELQELADSIKANGVIQPIVVRPGKDGRYFLITGSRRTEASKLAGKTKIPALVRHVSDQQAAEMTIVENLQRQDLNCYEQAKAFARLSQEFGLTQEQIGQRTGCDRSTVSNYMRLLKLPEDVQNLLRNGWLDFSQARCLLTLAVPEHISKLAKEAHEKHLSVDQLEVLIGRGDYPVAGSQIQHGVQPNTGRHGARWVDPNVKAAQRDLERILGVRVKIRDRRGKGKIVIEYVTLEDFDRVLEMLKGKN
jgi:ParB family transcriptional regulator, chromosome partitioning protein